MQARQAGRHAPGPADAAATGQVLPGEGASWRPCAVSRTGAGLWTLQEASALSVGYLRLFLQVCTAEEQTRV